MYDKLMMKWSAMIVDIPHDTKKTAKGIVNIANV